MMQLGHTKEMASEMIVVFPATKEPLQSARSRSITPQSERMASKQIAFISPLGSFPITSPSRVGSHLFTQSRHLFPSGEAFIDERLTLCPGHAHPEIPPWRHRISNKPFPRHIIFDFDLRTDSVFEEKSFIFYDIIPSTMSVLFDGWFLIFHLASLPPKPWPKRIAGLPCYFTTTEGDLGPSPPIYRPNFTHIRLLPDLNFSDDESRAEELFQLTKTHFINILVAITEIQYWGRFIVIVLESRHTDMSHLPQSIARCNCFYLYDDEMGRPLNHSALRHLDPARGYPDNSKYDTLRPGVMLSSGKHPTEGWELLTSSGVEVHDRNGYRYMTCTAHRFPHNGRVFHPNAGGQEIGTLLEEITHTDIGLVQLDKQISFTNEMFQNTVVPGPPIQLQRFNADEESRGKAEDDIYINSPFTGYIEGMQGVLSTCRIPADDPHEPEQPWIQTRWDYMGQDSSHNLEDGMCGSAIWNGQGDVLGFFRYAPKSGHFLDWCMSISSHELVKRGFSIVTDAHR
ncbi:TPA_exp: Uncharacterized protein A8136_4187 [Trichophyton benhamiae CBS 112371]|nr:TPA_exp: Uncharacterized protein A8136_4187 [Trichophyton benhamiae CBS 112371]